MSPKTPERSAPAGLDGCACCGDEANPTTPASRPAVPWGLPYDALASTAVSGALAGLGLLLDGSAATAAFAAAMLAGAWIVLPRAWAALRARSLDMNVLMLIAALGAAAIGEWAEGAAVIALFALAQCLERMAMTRARNAIAGLIETIPAAALVRRDGGEVTVPVEQVAVGERVIVKPGQRIPLDGVVQAGTSAVNEAPITGEALPVDKAPGMEVFAGTLNGHAALEIRTTLPAGDTVLARIRKSVEAAQASRAPVHAWVERMARVYTPAVVAVALAVALIPPLLDAGPWATWIYRALALLVIACPCALVISTPVTVVSGLTGAARDGVLIRGGAELERLATVNAEAFDKTGTITEGRPLVTDLAPVGGADSNGLLRLAAGVERHSEHPLAVAILAAAHAEALEVPAATGFAALPGRGARATVEGREVYVGSQRICCDDLGTCHPDAHAAIARFEEQGKTAVVLTSEDESFGVLAIADRVRSEARACLDALRRLGVTRILLLTGDNRAAAERVSRELGLAECRSALLPDDKLRAVHELHDAGLRLAVVGDGINDAPAMAAAHVGIAMGAAGSHVALETADVALMTDDLSRLPVAIGRARRTLRLVRQNVYFALGLKVVFLVLAVLGMATLWMAVLADTGASLIVIANGLRALRAPRVRPAPDGVTA